MKVLPPGVKALERLTDAATPKEAPHKEAGPGRNKSEEDAMLMAESQAILDDEDAETREAKRRPSRFVARDRLSVDKDPPPLIRKRRRHPFWEEDEDEDNDRRQQRREERAEQWRRTWIADQDMEAPEPLADSEATELEVEVYDEDDTRSLTKAEEVLLLYAVAMADGPERLSAAEHTLLKLAVAAGADERHLKEAAELEEDEDEE